MHVTSQADLHEYFNQVIQWSLLDQNFVLVHSILTKFIGNFISVLLIIKYTTGTY